MSRSRLPLDRAVPRWLLLAWAVVAIWTLLRAIDHALFIGAEVATGEVARANGLQKPGAANR